MKVFGDISQLVGGTPVVELRRYSSHLALQARILAKLEYFNPSGSVKDRAAKNMILEAETSGLLKEGSVIIEPTSGNTGIGLAALARIRGYRVILTMPETMSLERRVLLKAYGAELVLTDGPSGMSGAISKARELSEQIAGSFIPGQFVNPANPEAHYKTTGPEIWSDTDGTVDIFVAGVGTGGTLSGAGRYLKEKKPSIRVVAVEPEASALLSGGAAGSHGLQGIGANFIPDTLDRSVYDDIITVSDSEAYETGRLLAATEGFLAGITSGAAVCAGAKLARRPENRGKVIVALLPDSGERYLSTPMFSEV